MDVKRMALPEEADRLREIWAQSFEEDPDYAARFLQVFPPARHCLVYERDGAPVSMLWMLNARLCVDGRERPAQYIYAAATLPEYRGRGIFGELLGEAQRRAREAGCAASFLRPAEEGLFAYYERFGYTPYFYAAAETYTRAQLLEDSGNLPVTLATPAAYARARREFATTLPVWVDWGTPALTYARYLAGKAGGLAVTPRGCAVCETADADVLRVRELLCVPRDRRAVLASLTRRFPCQQMVVQSPAAGSEVRPFGALCPLADGVDESKLWKPRPYMGVALE